ncbi:hypothetical protein KZP23_14475 [Echinicola marina]|uniref:hypothetical protein n=1 Tax=Echinicola marina TaxID=2859768 RepID=UPI001CF69E22|nr:hypothetical protein [Echinicola marina]UCS91928.1 hypothetical protein KZP23_14475 [Echinicola marina]
MSTLFQRLSDFIIKKIKADKVEEFPFSMPEDLQQDGDIYLLIFRSNMIRAKIKRILGSIPRGYCHLDFYGDIKYQGAVLEELVNVKFGESHVLYTKNGAGESQFILKEEFSVHLERVLDELDDLLKAAELSIFLLKQSDFAYYTNKWGQLSRELKLSMHAKGFLPNQMKDVTYLWIEMSYKLNSFDYDVFKGIEALENLQALEINGRIDCEADFNKFSRLPKLKQLRLKEGPKIKWPNEHLNIEKGITLEEITVLNAQKPEAYQFIFSLEQVKKISLVNFNKQNIYHILDLLIHKDLEEINIHFSAKIEENKDGFLEDMIRPYCGNVRVNFYQPLEKAREEVMDEKVYW